MSVPTVDPGRSVAHRFVGRAIVSPLGLRFGRDIASRLDPTLLRLTRGRVSCVWPFPAVVFGRGCVIVIASNFGGPRNPAWYCNVETHPIVTLYGRGIGGCFIADEIYGAERDRLFDRAKDAPGRYGQYERAAAGQSRYIPVIAFTPQIREHTPRSRHTQNGTP